MSEEQIGFLLQRHVEDPWNAGSPDALDEVTADDFELGSGMDPDGFKEFIMSSHGDMNRRVCYGRETYDGTADL